MDPLVVGILVLGAGLIVAGIIWYGILGHPLVDRSVPDNESDDIVAMGMMGGVAMGMGVAAAGAAVIAEEESVVPLDPDLIDPPLTVFQRVEDTVEEIIVDAGMAIELGIESVEEAASSVSHSVENVLGLTPSTPIVDDPPVVPVEPSLGANNPDDLPTVTPDPIPTPIPTPIPDFTPDPAPVVHDWGSSEPVAPVTPASVPYAADPDPGPAYSPPPSSPPSAPDPEPYTSSDPSPSSSDQGGGGGGSSE